MLSRMYCIYILQFYFRKYNIFKLTSDCLAVILRWTDNLNVKYYRFKAEMCMIKLDEIQKKTSPYSIALIRSDLMWTRMPIYNFCTNH
jgi:ABC-type antimicrobial peptide transport system ATPase subunit